MLLVAAKARTQGTIEPAKAMSRYAEQTQVPVDRSKAEIERLLQRYGATEFVHGWKADRAIVQFKMKERYVRFVLPLPEIGEFTKTETGRARKAGTGAVTSAWEQACRQRWRALALSIKAKLESVESGNWHINDMAEARVRKNAVGHHNLC
jgi:hypothetical protein